MTGVDNRHVLEEDIFSSSGSKDGKVFIYYRGKLVKSLKGQSAQRFLDKIAAASPHEAQLVMAKITGNFKRGNEHEGTNPSGEYSL